MIKKFSPCLLFFKTKMVQRCVAGNCGSIPSPYVSLHKFPCKDTDLKRRMAWIRAVKLTRKNWKGPSNSSCLCSRHFTENDILSSNAQTVENMERLGFEMKRKTELRRDAVPTLFSITNVRQSPRKRPTLAREKRARYCQEVTEKLTAEVQHSTQASSSPTVMEVNEPTETEAQITPTETLVLEQLSETTPDEPQAHYMSAEVGCRSIGTQTMHTENVHLHVAACLPGQVAEVLTSDSVSGKVSGSPCKETTLKEGGEQGDEDDVDSDSLFDLEENEILAEQSSGMSESDSDFVPQLETSSEFSDVGPLAESDDEVAQPKPRRFIVCEDELNELLHLVPCRECSACGMDAEKTITGTLLKVTLSCGECGSKRVWLSQPYVGETPVMNIVLSSSILCAGATVSKVLKVMNHMGVATITARTFFRHQKEIIAPSIIKLWRNSQEWYVANLLSQERGLVLGGDGRADSPGHSAKFGTYSTIELQENAVINVAVVQSNECGGSYHMELEGLRRTVAWLEEEGLPVSLLVTDRHRQIAKWIRENMPETRHRYDCWHIAKSLSKKLRSLANTRDGADIKGWLHSINNHLYWCASSSADDDEELKAAKWLSLSNHIQNIHTGHGEPFPECQHGPLVGREAEKDWLDPGSSAAIQLDKIIRRPDLIKDIKKMSSTDQTSCVEAFHSLITQFAPKMVIFSYEGITCRCILAALHYNENSSRQQRVKRDGEGMFHMTMPKWKKDGSWIVRAVKADSTYGYVQDIMHGVLDRCRAKRAKRSPDPLKEVPPTLTASSGVPRPRKADAIAAHVDRFNVAP